MFLLIYILSRNTSATYLEVVSMGVDQFLHNLALVCCQPRRGRSPRLPLQVATGPQLVVIGIIVLPSHLPLLLASERQGRRVTAETLVCVEHELVLRIVLTQILCLFP